MTHCEVSEQPALFYKMGKSRVPPTAIFKTTINIMFSKMQEANEFPN